MGMKKIYYSKLYPLLLVIIATLSIFVPVWITGLLYEKMTITSFLMIVILILGFTLLEYILALYLMSISEIPSRDHFIHRDFVKSSKILDYDYLFSKLHYEQSSFKINGLTCFKKKKFMMSPFEPYTGVITILYCLVSKDELDHVALLSNDYSTYPVFILDCNNLDIIKNKLKDTNNYALITFENGRIITHFKPFLYPMSKNNKGITKLINRVFSFDNTVILLYLTQQIRFEIIRFLRS